jgi:2-keto-4-pentenoate hydratase/2-oxohepta-3-ene-1,7-dioic acid hydratase in catechol pathway
MEISEGILCDLREAGKVLARDGSLEGSLAETLTASDLKTFLSLGEVALEAASRVGGLLMGGDPTLGRGLYSRSVVKLLPPIPNPGKIIAVGLNYRDHAEEQKASLPASPMIFAKFPTALIGHEDPIRLPAVSRKVDVEAELCVVIGRSGRGFSESAAQSAIVGFTVGNDVSARDLQYADRQWVRGKSCDTFAPCGPFLVTPEETDDPHSLKIELRLNGRVQQSSNTSQMVFNSYQLVSYISQVITLETGDLLYTGTPAGVGVFRDPPVFLAAGDVVEVTIERIGTLRNPVVA